MSIHPRRSKIRLVITELLEPRILFTDTPLYWNPTTGTRTWDTVSTNTPWHTGSPDGPAVAWSNGGDYQAVFPDGSSTSVTVGGNVTVDSISFAGDGYILSGSYSLTLSGESSSIDVAGTNTATIDVPITGTSGLAFTDTGTLILGTANSYAGGTTVDTGTLQLASPATLGSPSNALDVENDGMIDMNGTSQTVTAITGSYGNFIDSQTGSVLTIPNGTVSANIQLSGDVGLDFTGENDGTIDIGPSHLQVSNGTLINNGLIATGTPSLMSSMMARCSTINCWLNSTARSMSKPAVPLRTMAVYM